jgi:adenosylmethionine-8-amino-7-oxononanoate aminotransferase
MANIRLYRTENLLRSIRSNGTYLRKRLKGIQGCSVVGEVVHKGLLGAIDLVNKKEKKPLELLDDHGRKVRTNYYIAQEALKMGVFIRGLGSTLLVIPPLAIGKGDFKFLLDVICELTKKIEDMV